jgi:hypothetical protein
MGFMDKAKKMAEQAQAKIDEAQKQFNERQGAPAPPGGGAGTPVTDYDQHGRPIRSEGPPDTATPPHGDPVGGPTADAPPAPPSSPTADPSAPPPGASAGAPAAGPDAAPSAPPTPPAGPEAAPGTPPAPPAGGPQPDRPDEYAPPKLSSGDPLTG